jgi:urease gamma subunit
MTTANPNLTFEQLVVAIGKIPVAQQIKLWHLLDTKLNRNAIRRQARDEFAQAVEAIRTANEGVNEDDVMADVTAVVKQVRAERRARHS